MTSSKLLLALALATAFSFAQPVKADRRVDGGPVKVDCRVDGGGTNVNEVVSVPDGGSTVSLLGCALLGLAVLRRKLSC